MQQSISFAFSLGQLYIYARTFLFQSFRILLSIDHRHEEPLMVNIHPKYYLNSWSYVSSHFDYSMLLYQHSVCLEAQDWSQHYNYFYSNLCSSLQNCHSLSRTQRSFCFNYLPLPSNFHLISSKNSYYSTLKHLPLKEIDHLIEYF